MDAVASQGSKSRATFESGMLKSAIEAFLPFEERPDPNDNARFLASCPAEDMAATVSETFRLL
jgi:hypothetical protein